MWGLLGNWRLFLEVRLPNPNLPEASERILTRLRQIPDSLFVKWLPRLIRDHQDGQLSHSDLLRRFYTYGRVLPKHIVTCLARIPAAKEYAADMQTWSGVLYAARERCRERCRKMVELTDKRLDYQKLMRISMSEALKATEAECAAQRHMDAIFSK